MKRYTLGFIFETDFKRVVLIKKNRPDWQKGMLNGVGGKVEENETAPACIAREVCEETGLITNEKDWTHVAVIGGPDWTMDVFAIVHTGEENAVHTRTDEAVGWYEVARLPGHALSNVSWLVQLSKDILQNEKIENVVVSYRQEDS